MIPHTRQWIVTTGAGSFGGELHGDREKWVVKAPTKLLAKLNFQHVHPGARIVRIGVGRDRPERGDGWCWRLWPGDFAEAMWGAGAVAREAGVDLTDEETSWALMRLSEGISAKFLGRRVLAVRAEAAAS